MAPKRRKTKLSDTVVIYREGDDWVAHSIKTDQIGVGPRIVEALAQAIRLVQLLLEEAEKDGTLAVEREAPPEVRALLKSANS